MVQDYSVQLNSEFIQQDRLSTSTQPLLRYLIHTRRADQQESDDRSRVNLFHEVVGEEPRNTIPDESAQLETQLLKLMQDGPDEGKNKERFKNKTVGRILENRDMVC